MFTYNCSIYRYSKKVNPFLTACTYKEREILLRISKGDSLAFTILFNAYKDKVYTIAYRITGSEFTAEEVVQEIFAKLWARRLELPKVEHFNAWFNTITRNHLFSLIKRDLAREAREESFARRETGFNNNVEQLVLLKETQTVLAKAMYELTPQQIKIYRLIKENGMKKEEVAVKLNLSTETVKVHLSKAVKSIRAYYAAHMNYPVILVLCFSVF